MLILGTSLPLYSLLTTFFFNAKIYAFFVFISSWSVCLREQKVAKHATVEGDV